MKTGLLWFDDDPRKTLTEKVRRAAAHYERKYAHPPDLCFVHPGACGEDGKRVIRVGGVEVRPGRSVLPHHLWLGVDEGNGPAALEQARQSALALETAPPGQEV